MKAEQTSKSHLTKDSKNMNVEINPLDKVVIDNISIPGSHRDTERANKAVAGRATR